MIKYVLFDLDGTLLPMDQDIFVKGYFGTMCQKMVPHGYDKDDLIKGIWAGTKAMVKNDGSVSNEQAFWDCFRQIFGDRVDADKPLFDEYYHEKFPEVQRSCGYNPQAKETVDKIKEMGFKVVLATNPIFPSIATEHRIRWAGFEPSDFEFFTTYENNRHCKPNPDYYRDIVENLGCDPKECLMVGNDVGEDMVAEKLGMKVFLLTDCIINKDGTDISVYPNGGFSELLEYVKTLK